MPLVPGRLLCCRGSGWISCRWCIQRTLAWLTAHRRLARHCERDPATSEAMIRWAAINTMTSRIAPTDPPHGSNAGTGPASHDRVSATR